ncbi:MAG: futalosine hydrolase [Deltaproteobacteria bacterium]|nr:futalosine hydrolase [Deltaproteobacteria bacterium]
MTIAIIAATKLELALLLEEFQARYFDTELGCALFSARRGERELVIVESGPGLANAAAAAAVVCMRVRPLRIFNCGVCGVYAADAALLGSVAVGIRAVFADTGVASEEDFLSMEDIDLPLAISAEGRDTFNVIDLDCVDVLREIQRGCFLSVAAVSGCAAHAESLKARFGADADELVCEDMESAAVALVAHKAGIPCTVLRGISNLCGERDYQKWKLQEAAENAQRVLIKLLSS